MRCHPAADSIKPSSSPTCLTPFPAAAPTWSRASFAAGTNCGRCRQVNSRDFASSFCSRTGRRTACRAITRPRLADARGFRTYDFPQRSPDPDGQTWNTPNLVGLFDTQSGTQSPALQPRRCSGTPPTRSTQSRHIFRRPAGTHMVEARGSRLRFRSRLGTLNVNNVPQIGSAWLAEPAPGDRTLSGGRLEHQQCRA